MVPASDVTITPGLLDGYYERIELDIFERLAERSHRVVDVGGHIGIYACLGGLRLPQGGSLITFEPAAESVEFCAATSGRAGSTTG